jgi:DNA-binding MarR family transcriptional regulator
MKGASTERARVRAVCPAGDSGPGGGKEGGADCLRAVLDTLIVCYGRYRVDHESILMLLKICEAQAGGQAHDVSSLAFDIGWPVATTSRRVKRLTRSGLVATRRSGRSLRVVPTDEGRNIIRCMDELLARKIERPDADCDALLCPPGLGGR